MRIRVGDYRLAQYIGKKFWVDPTGHQYTVEHNHAIWVEDHGEELRITPEELDRHGNGIDVLLDRGWIRISYGSVQASSKVSRGLLIRVIKGVAQNEGLKLGEYMHVDIDYKHVALSLDALGRFDMQQLDQLLRRKNAEAFHGTTSTFTLVEPGRSGLGMHFGTLRAAKERLQESSRRRDPATIILYDLQISNSLELPDFIDWAEVSACADELMSADVLDYDEYLDILDMEPAPAFGLMRTRLEEAGYDSIVYRNSVEDKGSASYVVWDPAKIKEIHRVSGPGAREREEKDFPPPKSIRAKVGSTFEVTDTQARPHGIRVGDVRPGDRVRFKEDFELDLDDEELLVRKDEVGEVVKIDAQSPYLTVRVGGIINNGRNRSQRDVEVDVTRAEVDLIMSDADPRIN